MLWTIIVSVVMGAIIGWIASLIMKAHTSLWFNILIGIVGSAIGGWVGSILGITLTIWTINVMGLALAVVFACLLIFIVGKLKKD